MFLDSGDSDSDNSVSDDESDVDGCDLETAEGMNLIQFGGKETRGRREDSDEGGRGSHIS